MTGQPVRIALLAGRMKFPDRRGHHDYAAGCALLGLLLRQTSQVEPIVIREWPDDERVLDGARAVVCYADGGGRQPFLATPERIERVQALSERGTGLVMIHQAVSFAPDFARQAESWLGGAHVRGSSGRGHWRSRHREFPEHPVTRGVEPWAIRDGWFNRIRFVDGMRGVTPLVWSGSNQQGSPAGGEADVAAWAYERPTGGRSVCFSGLDAHSAWSVPGVRQLLVNGILWSAGMQVPLGGAPCAVADATSRALLTPRGSQASWAFSKGWRLLRRLAH